MLDADEIHVYSLLNLAGQLMCNTHEIRVFGICGKIICETFEFKVPIIYSAVCFYDLGLFAA